MAAELIGTTVGVVGFLGQLFDGCVKAYGYFTTASHMDVDSQRLLCKVRIEEMRLVVWGREWGVAEGNFEAHLDSSDKSNPRLRALATEILKELHSTVTDFRKLKEVYGLADGAMSSADAAGSAPGADGKGADAVSSGGGGRKTSPSPSGKAGGKNDKSNGVKGERSFRKEFLLRSKWVIAGKYLYVPCWD
jgi:hypothetical protein